MIKEHEAIQGSEEWRKGRVGHYSGSNAHKLLGSFGATEYAKAIEDSFRGNFTTRRAHILEDEACQLYEAITKSKVKHCGFVSNTKYPDCIYSPDGLAPLALIEIKCFDIPHHMQLIKGDIPLKVLAQIHFGLLITERPFAHLVPYNPSKELPVKDQFKIIRIARNRNIENNFKRILKGVVHA